MTEEPKQAEQVFREWKVVVERDGDMCVCEVGTGRVICDPDAYGPNVFEENRQICQQICDDHNQIAALRKALADLLALGPEIVYQEFGWPSQYFVCCGGVEEHKQDCPWLLAAQLLEQEPPAQSGPEQDER